MQAATNPSPGFQRNPGRRITIAPFNGTVNVSFSDAIIASTKRAKVVREEDDPPVFYIPFEDIYFDFLRPTDTTHYSPYIGDAAHWGVTAVGESLADVMWAYRTPFDEMAELRDHGAFYSDKVRIEATEKGEVGRDL